MPLKRKRFSCAIAMLLLPALVWACAGQKTAPPAIMAVAVWPIEDFSPVGNGDKGLGDLLWNRIMAALQGRSDVTLVERQRLDLALEELKLSTTGLVDETARLDLGRLIGAGAMVFGGYQVIGDQMRLDLRLVEVETGKVLRSVEKVSTSGGLVDRLKAGEEAALSLF